MIWILLLANAYMISMSAYNYRFLPPEVPFYYIYTWGEGRLAHSFVLVLPIIMLNTAYLLTKVIVRKYYHSDPFITKIVQVAQLIFIALALIIVTRTIMISI